MILERSKFAIAKYFPDVNIYIEFIKNNLKQRIENKKIIGDISDVYGKIIDEEKIKEASNILLES
jgi:hypothetical protein